MTTNNLTELNAVSSVDGRYGKKTATLRPIMSEEGLIRRRLLMEILYIIFLSRKEGIDIPPITDEDAKSLLKIPKNADAPAMVKKIEETTNHDVKATEYYIVSCISGTKLELYINFIHFALTSEDTTNIALALMAMEAVNEVILPILDDVMRNLKHMIQDYADIPMLAHTHGQPASPTTVGKEISVHYKRLKRQREKLKLFIILIKLNGASGNYNAHQAAYPQEDWPKFTKDFTAYLQSETGIKLEANLHTTQIEPFDAFVELFQIFHNINMITLDFCQDTWQYISDDYYALKPKDGEIGSSTMPQKVNPINFENTEGNALIANAFFDCYCNVLQKSRRQRDLSCSTVSRTFGTAFAHCVIAYTSLQDGLGKLLLNRAVLNDDLEGNPAVISEALQTIMRDNGIDKPYEVLKEFTRGKPDITLEDLHTFVDELDGIDDSTKKRMKDIIPSNYTGIADKLAKMAI